MTLLIFPWFHHHDWIVQHMTFMSFSFLNLPTSQRALSDPPGPPRTLQQHPKEPLRLPKDLPGTPKDLPRTAKAGNLNSM